MATSASAVASIALAAFMSVSCSKAPAPARTDSAGTAASTPAVTPTAQPAATSITPASSKTTPQASAAKGATPPAVSASKGKATSPRIAPTTSVPVSDASPTTRQGAVVIDSIVPKGATVTRGELIAVMIYGKGFTLSDNAVLLDGSPVASIRSADSVHARLILPATFPATGEAPPRTVAPGEYRFQIKNTRGTSNAVKLTLRNPQ